MVHSSFVVFSQIIAFKQIQTRLLTALNFSLYITTYTTTGVAYWTAFYPADTVKSAIQTNPEFAEVSFYQTFMSMARNEGVGSLYRGWGITVLRAAPAHALIFACYEETLKWMN